MLNTYYVNEQNWNRLVDPYPDFHVFQVRAKAPMQFVFLLAVNYTSVKMCRLLSRD